MAGQNGLATELGGLLIADLRENGNDSAYCRLLERLDEGFGGLNPGVRSSRELFCEPPPQEPPSSENIPGGGTPCRVYNVTVESINSAGSSTVFVIEGVRGPVRLQRYRTTNPPNRFLGTDSVVGGDGINCPVIATQASGFDGVTPEEVYSTIIAVTPIDGLPPDENPFPNPPPPIPQPEGDELTFDIDVNLGGQQFNFPLSFQPIIQTNIGPIIPVFAPITPQFQFNFDPQVDIEPRVGIDINLDFAIPLPPGGTGGPNTNTDAPVPLPPVGGDVECPDTEVDYDRIEEIIASYVCCAPITDVVPIGTHEFDNPNDVREFSVPDNAVAAFISIIPANNSRVYKFAGADSEYGHGNASLLVNGSSLGFERLFVNNHALFYPEKTANKALRVSCVEGTIVSVTVGVYVAPEE